MSCSIAFTTKAVPCLTSLLPRGAQCWQNCINHMGGFPVSFSDGLVGCGRTFFEKVVQQGHEGVMGKHLAGRYVPGRRESAWRKIKPWQVTACVIIGYTRSREGFSSLLVAAAEGKTLRYVGQLSGGFTRQVRTRLMPRLIESRCRTSRRSLARSGPSG